MTLDNSKIHSKWGYVQAISCISLTIEYSRLIRTYLEFRYSELGDSNWNRILSILALKKYKDPVSNIETSHWRINISNSPLVKSVNRLVDMKMP